MLWYLVFTYAAAQGLAEFTGIKPNAFALGAGVQLKKLVRSGGRFKADVMAFGALHGWVSFDLCFA